MTPFMIYCWLMLDGIKAFFIIVASIGTIACFGEFAINFESFGKSKSMKVPAILGLITLIISAVATIIPSTKQAAIIFGVPALIQSAKDTNADKIPAKLVDYLNTYLDNEIEKVEK